MLWIESECIDCKLLWCKSVLIGRIWILARRCHMTASALERPASSIHKGWARCQSMTKDKSEERRSSSSEAFGTLSAPLNMQNLEFHFNFSLSFCCRSKKFSSNAKKATRANLCTSVTTARIKSILAFVKWKYFDTEVKINLHLKYRNSIGQKLIENAKMVTSIWWVLGTSVACGQRVLPDRSIVN